MTYFTANRKLQKDLYVKKDLDIQDSTTPWVPKSNIRISSIMVKAYTAPTGTGSTTVRIYKNKGTASESILSDLVLSSTTTSIETANSYSQDIEANSEITYSITTTTSVHPGKDAIINFIYELV